MIASKLKLGDEVRVIAPSRNLTEVRQDVHHHAVDFWKRDYFCYEFDRNLESLLQIDGADTIKGIVFGRFDDSCGLTVEAITDIIQDKVPANIPVIFGADFGHVFPMIMFPIGGTVKISTNRDGIEIRIITH